MCFFFDGTPAGEDITALTVNLRARSVSLVGVSLVTDDYASAVKVTAALKASLPVRVIWGGAHVNVMPEESLRHADMICLGEGEDALLELAGSLASGGTPDTTIKNIWFSTGKGVVRNEMRPLVENLDRYPAPDFDLDSQYVISRGTVVKMGEDHLKGEYSVMTSRGCPYACTYCYNSYRKKHYEGKGRYLRNRSIFAVIEELGAAKKLFPRLQRINFWDDSFVARPTAEFEEFGAMYRDRVALPFFALIEPMAFDFEKIKLLRQAGLSALQVGIQSGSERVNREVYGRRVTRDKILEVAGQIASLGIRATYDLIFNNPYETIDDLRETISMLAKFPQPLYLQGYSLIFYPGTELTQRALADGYITLKPPVDDFSPIQDKRNSPFAMKGKADVSGRFYSVNYDSSDKEYFNSVISLFGYTKIPRKISVYFGRSENAFKHMLLKALMEVYIAASRIKNACLPS